MDIFVLIIYAFPFQIFFTGGSKSGGGGSSKGGSKSDGGKGKGGSKNKKPHYDDDYAHAK